MPGELDLDGVYVPSFLILMLVAYGLNRVLRAGLSRTGLYRLVWHRALFDLALYVLVLGAVFGLSRRFA